MLFIDFSGNIVVGGNEPDHESVSKIEPLHSSENINHFESADNMNSDFDSDPDTDIRDIELTTNEYSQVIDKDSVEIAIEPSDSHAVLDSISEDNFNAEQTPLTVDIQEDFSILTQPNEPNEQVLTNEINSSANAEPITAMNYKLQIRGIDTAALRKTVLEALFDKRLGLVSNEISESINNGCLTVTGLNPVKASFILNTLKQYPLEIDWELNAQS